MICPFCSSNDLYLKKKIISNINKKNYDLYFCKSCYLEFYSPLIFENVYSTEIVAGYSNYHDKNKMFFTSRNYEVMHYINNYVTNIRDKYILDVGAGNGVNFVLLKKNFDISPDNYYAIELDEKSIGVCKENGITNFICEFFNIEIANKVQKKFDIIILTEVLEHQTNPSNFIQGLFLLLNEGGIIIITVPNAGRFFKNDNDDIAPHHFLHLYKNFFKKNFKTIYLKTFVYRSRDLIKISKYISNFIFGTEKLFFIFIPLAMIFFIIDLFNGDGLLVVINNKI